MVYDTWDPDSTATVTTEALVHRGQNLVTTGLFPLIFEPLPQRKLRVSPRTVGGHTYIVVETTFDVMYTRIAFSTLPGDLYLQDQLQVR